MAISDIDNAIVAHRAWVARFQSAITGRNTEVFDLSKARDDTACDLGCWLHSENSHTLGEESRERIVAMHCAFHEIAWEIAAKLNRHDETSEVSEYTVEFDRLSKQLVLLLLLAKKNLQGEV